MTLVRNCAWTSSNYTFNCSWHIYCCQLAARVAVYILENTWLVTKISFKELLTILISLSRFTSDTWTCIFLLTRLSGRATRCVSLKSFKKSQFSSNLHHHIQVGSHRRVGHFLQALARRCDQLVSYQLEPWRAFSHRCEILWLMIFRFRRLFQSRLYEPSHTAVYTSKTEKMVLFKDSHCKSPWNQ